MVVLHGEHDSQTVGFSGASHESKLKLELFKRFHYNFLPLGKTYEEGLTVAEAAELAKCGGSCGGPYYPIRSQQTKKSRELEQIGKALAGRYRIPFETVNEIPRNAHPIRYSKPYRGYRNLVSSWKKWRFKIRSFPALVVSSGDKWVIITDPVRAADELAAFLRAHQ